MPPELEDRDAGGERLRRERMPERIRTALLHPRRLERRVPLPRPPRVEADRPALGRREQKRSVEPRRKVLDRVEGASGERDTPARTLRLRIRGQHPVSDPPLHGDSQTGPVYVTALERDPLVRPQARLGRAETGVGLGPSEHEKGTGP